MYDEDGTDDCVLGLEQLPVVSGTGVIIGEDLIEGHSWTMGVVFDPHLPTGSVHVTREPDVAWQPSGMTLRSMRNETINPLKRD